MEPTPVFDIAPLDGTIHYPREALLMLTRTVLREFEASWAAKSADSTHISDPVSSSSTAPEEVDDLDEDPRDKPSPMPNDPISAIRAVRHGLDRQSFRDEQATDEGYSDDADFDQDIKLEEQYLFGPGDPGRPWVIEAAVKLFKESRGLQEDTDEYYAHLWREDALLDLLVFITRDGHAGLFQIAEEL